jgi:hypothetical protein
MTPARAAVEMDASIAAISNLLASAEEVWAGWLVSRARRLNC